MRSVGIGSDYDGIGSTPIGLEDVSKYPALVSCLCVTRGRDDPDTRVQIVELIKRSWKRSELEGLTSKNLLRILEGVERVMKELQAKGTEPSYDLYDKRTDLPRSRDL